MPKANDKTTTMDSSKWTDEWVTKLAADPNKVPGVTVLTGFIGRSSDGKSVRVFLNAELQNWADIPAEAILHREPVPKTVSPLGGSYLWVDRTAWSACKMNQVQYETPQQQ